MENHILTFIVSILNLIFLALLSFLGRKWVNDKHTKIISLYSKKEVLFRLRVQREFEIYQFLWKKLFSLQKSTRELLANLNVYIAGVGSREEVGKNLEKFISDIEDAAKVINNNIPFYSEKIFKHANEISEISNGISLGFLIPKIDQKQVGEFEKMERRICDLIQKIESFMREQFRSEINENNQD